jgi:hypothetical protein
MKPDLIDTDFITQWEIKYDSLEGDENDYKSIQNLVMIELRSTNSISKNTFIQLINWKSPRLKGIVKVTDYENYYRPVIEKCIVENDLRSKLRLLVSLYGISFPSATTILHFIYPDVFPIIDFRTTEALNHFGLLKSARISENSYWIFFNVIHKIKTDTNFSLRKIDRALFSYNKISMKNRLGSTKIERVCKTISFATNETINETTNKEYTNNQRVLESYIFSSYKMSVADFTRYLADKYITDDHQKEIFLRKGIWLKVHLNYIAGLILTSRGKSIFSPKEVREIVRVELIPSIYRMNDGSLSGLILTQDVHDKAKKEYNNGYPCLKKIERGKYQFIRFS